MNTGNNGPAGQPASGPGESAEATPPTINWPAWLEEYYQADQADRIAGRLYDESSKDPDLKEAEEAALTNLHNIVAAIEGTPADSQEALAVKLAMQWNYHADFPLDNNNELTDPLNGELILLRTTLDSLAAQTGLPLFEIYSRDGPSVYPDPTDEPDAGLLWLEREYLRNVHYIDNPPLDNPSRKNLPDETHDAYAHRRNEILQKVARTIAASPAGVAAKMRLLREEFESLKSAWADEGWETCLTSLEKMNGGTVEPRAEIETAHAPNIAAAAERLNVLPAIPSDRISPELAKPAAVLHQFKGLDPDDDEDLLTALINEMYALAPIAIAKPAQSLSEILVKMRLALWHEGDREEYAYDLAYLKSAIADAERLDDVVAVPDAKLFALEVEMKAAHEGLAPVPDDDDDVRQIYIDRMIAVEAAAQAIPAQTSAGVLAKLRMAAWYVKTDPAIHLDADEIWLRNIVADVQRLGGAS